LFLHKLEAKRRECFAAAGGSEIDLRKCSREILLEFEGELQRDDLKLIALAANSG